MIEEEVLKICQKAVEGYEKRAIQEEMIRRIVRWLENEPEKPFIIRLPTGYGKTLIGVAPVLYQISSGDYRFSRGLTYVLPMRALCSQVARDVRKFTERITNKRIKIEEFHGAAIHSSRFEGDVIVATYDTFVYAYARKLGAQLEYPAGTLATSLIVFDEAQLLQDENFYSYTLLNRIFLSFSRAGVPILLMTATLPGKIRETIFRGIDDYMDPYERDRSYFENLRNENFKGRIVEAQFHEGRRMDQGMIQYITHDLTKEYEKIFGDRPKRILVIVNTVKRLRRLLNEFRIIRQKSTNDILQGYELVVLHGMLKKAERSNKAERLREICGKPNERAVDKPALILTTQVIEAGINISADLVITELAPADSLIQRAGRCARFRGEEGMFVITDVENNEPYPKELVEKTRDSLNSYQGSLEDMLMDFEKSTSFIEDVYEEYVPENLSRNYEALRYIMYLETSLGILSGDLETASKLKARLDNYIEVIFPEGEVEYAIASETEEGYFYIKNRFVTSEFDSILRLALELKLKKEKAKHVIILGNKVCKDNADIKDWLLGNSVSISLNEWRRNVLEKILSWNFEEKYGKAYFILSELPAGKVVDFSSSTALLIPCSEIRMSRRIYLGNPEFYEPDIGVKI